MNSRVVWRPCSSKQQNVTVAILINGTEFSVSDNAGQAIKTVAQLMLKEWEVRKAVCLLIIQHIYLYMYNIYDVLKFDPHTQQSFGQELPRLWVEPWMIEDFLTLVSESQFGPQFGNPSFNDITTRLMATQDIIQVKPRAHYIPKM